LPLSASDYGLIPISNVDKTTISFFNFTCGKPNLDNFIKTDARDLHESRICHTYCIFHNDFKGLVGYITLSSDSIKLNSSEVMELGVNSEVTISNIPAVLIGKFAINSELQGNGCGTAIMSLAVDMILAANPASARLAVVDAINESRVIKFYEQCGFKRSIHSEKQAKSQGRQSTVKMFKDVLLE
jgi:ribosomal protein S18 acetylase RimI-like enzyme